MGYKMIANCVPGPMMDIVGRPALYTKVLQILMPSIYSDLKLIAAGDDDTCMSAANSVNSNSVLYGDVTSTEYPSGSGKKMTELGIMKSMEPYDNTTSYLFIFENKEFQDYTYIANSVPGDVVSSLEQTAGKPALYTVALQTILPSLLGDLQYLGETEIADDSHQAMNAINTGNTSMLELLKDKTSGLAISEVGILNGLKNASIGSSYLYIFKNKMWNGTWDVMTARRLSEDIVA